MRFAIQFTGRRGLRIRRRTKDWAMPWRMVSLLVPTCIAVVMLTLYFSFSTSRESLDSSLETPPLLEAKVSVKVLETSLLQVRNSILSIAEHGYIDAEDMQKSVSILFHENVNLIVEIAIKSTKDESYYLLRNTKNFTKLSLSDAAYGMYSPFQQIGTRPLTANQATIFPAVIYSPVSLEQSPGTSFSPLIRLAVPLADGSGILIVGISLHEWHKTLARFIESLNFATGGKQDKIGQLIYFFDTEGWILFEMGRSTANSFFPDTARRGFSGDFGKPGYDAAFRPWPVHIDFWRSVTGAREGKSGAIRIQNSNSLALTASEYGTMCYAPVSFSVGEGITPETMGGIIVFDTSSLSMAAFIQAANLSMVIIVIALFIFLLLAFLSGKKMASPLIALTADLKGMNDLNEYSSINVSPACHEHHQINSAINFLISRHLVLQRNMEISSKQVENARSSLPVNLSQVVVSPSFHVKHGLVGSSRAIQSVREKVQKAARAGTDVLIWGETGTGKELVTSAVHKASVREGGPYISINCGALDENLLLDALFGHVKGAFTEAKTDREGAFLAAEGGSLHLDEIANASLKVQQALLRALSVRRIRPLGTDSEIPFNTRVISATNVNLKNSVRTGTFREDLYYRLAIISIEIPPLRHRKEDISEFAAFCLHETAQLTGQPGHRISRGALDKLIAHDWPGNIREFKNCMLRAMAFAEDDLILDRHIVLDDAFLGLHETTKQSMPVIVQKDEALGKTANRATAPQETTSHGQGNTSQAAPMDQEDSIFYLWGNDTHRRQEVISETSPGPQPETQLPPQRDIVHKKEPASVKAHLSDRQVAGLEFAKNHGSISRMQYEEIISILAGESVSPRTAQNDLKELVQQNLIERIGAGPKTHYIAK